MENNFGHRFGRRRSLSTETSQENSLANAAVNKNLDAWLEKNNIPERLVSLHDFQEILSKDFLNSKQKRFRPMRFLGNLKPSYWNRIRRSWALKPNFPIYTNDKRLIQLKNRNAGENKEDLQDQEEDQSSALGSIGLKPKIVH